MVAKLYRAINIFDETRNRVDKIRKDNKWTWDRTINELIDQYYGVRDEKQEQDSRVSPTIQSRVSVIEHNQTALTGFLNNPTWYNTQKLLYSGKEL